MVYQEEGEGCDSETVTNRCFLWLFINKGLTVDCTFFSISICYWSSLCFPTGSPVYWPDVVPVVSWGSASAWHHQSWHSMGHHGGSLLLQRPRGGRSPCCVMICHYLKKTCFLRHFSMFKPQWPFAIIKQNYCFEFLTGEEKLNIVMNSTDEAIINCVAKYIFLFTMLKENQNVWVCSL